MSFLHTLIISLPLLMALAGAMLFELPRVTTLPPLEAPWREQVERVRAGRVPTIHIQREIIEDAQIAQLVGLDYLIELELGQHALTPHGARLLQQLPSLRRLTLRGAPVDDALFGELCRIRTLRYLNVPHTMVSDEGLAAVRERPQLLQLRLGSRQITPDGLAHLRALDRLRFLHLIDVPVTDAGLTHIAKLKSLESLYLDGAEFTDEGIINLLESLPGLHLHVDQQHHDRDPQRDAHVH